MATEIELKLAIAAEDIATLQDYLNKNAEFSGQAELLNQYFDTPGLALNKARCALRIRNKNNAFEQTLKTAGQKDAALQVRGEWNWPLVNNALDLSLLNDADVRLVWPEGVELNALQPIFSTDFNRTTWLWQQGQARIEIALDVGAVQAKKRSLPLCEVELELLAGDSEYLWQLHQSLNQVVTLSPSGISKAQRGYELFL